MVNKINYTLVGLFFVAVITAFGVVAWWMSGKQNDSNFKSYFIHTSELPSGIKQDSVVKFIGVDAGRVKAIKFANEKDATIEIEVAVKKDLPISKNSIARAELQGITGLGYINISKGNGESFADNEKPIIALQASTLAAISMKATDITEKIDATLLHLNEILSTQNSQKVGIILDNLQNFTAKLSVADTNLTPILQNTNAVLSSIKNLVDNSQNSINLANSVLKNSDKSVAELGKVAILLQGKISNGEYDIKDSLNSLTTQSQATLIEFSKALKEFRDTLFRLEEKPYEFFFKDPKDKK